MREQIAKIYRRRPNNQPDKQLLADGERTYEKYVEKEVERERSQARKQKNQQIEDLINDNKQVQIIAKAQEKAKLEQNNINNELEQINSDKDRILSRLKEFKDELAGLDEDFGNEKEIKRAKELKEKIQKGENKLQELEEKLKILKGE